jgi:hypothetical protein
MIHPIITFFSSVINIFSVCLRDKNNVNQTKQQQQQERKEDYLFSVFSLSLLL